MASLNEVSDSSRSPLSSDEFDSNGRQTTVDDASSPSKELCLICGDQANGVHYNVLSCEGCKSFFLRSIKNKTVDSFQCASNGKCDIDTFTRRKCPFCRMKKCKKLGMTSEKVWNEKRLVTRKPLERKKKVKGYKDMEHQERKRTEKRVILEEEEEPVVVQLTDSEKNLAHATGTCFSKAIEPIPYYPRVADVSPPEEEEEEEANDERPSSSSSTSDSSSQAGVHLSQEALQHSMEGITLFVMQLVTFAKSLPDFERLGLEDKQVLIKEGVTEALAVRCGYCFHLDKQLVIIYENTYTRRLIDMLGTPAFGRLFWKFLHDFKALHLTLEETALFLAVVLFTPDRPGLSDQGAVERIQQKFVSALESCIRFNHRGEGERELFPRLMLKLVSLRDITSTNSDTLLQLKLQKKHWFTPFFAELYDL